MQKSQLCAETGDVQNVTTKSCTTIITSDSSINQDEPEKDSEINKSYLFQIPLELLGKLLDKYIPHADKLRLRLVHPTFRALFDTYIGFKVSLDDENPAQKFAFISQLAIRKTNIQNLTCFNKNSSPPTFGEIFLYPQLLQEIIIEGNIDAEVFNGIVRHCVALKLLDLRPGSNIKSGGGHLTKNKTKKNNKKNTDKTIKKKDRVILPEIDIFPASAKSPPPETYYLSKLRCIKLLLNQDTSLNPEATSSPPDINTEAVLSIMKSLKSAHLERVVLQGWISSRYSVALLTNIAAECLERNPRIESFFLGVIYEHLISDGDPVPEEDLELRSLTLERLKKAGDSVNITKFGISTQSGDLVLWKEFLKRQFHLVHISFTVDLVEGGGFCQEMFKSSAKTLRQFILRGKFLTSFDFTWIQDCTGMREICLHNIDHHDQSTNPLLHAINSSAIPDGLESLVLFQTICRSEEILTAVRKLKLKTLVLFKTGNNAGETGVNVDCLKHIFRCRTLESILMVRFVAPNTMEAGELVRILQTMNDGQIHREVYGADEIPQLIPGATAAVADDDDDWSEPPPLIQIQSSDVLEDFIKTVKDEEISGKLGVVEEVILAGSSSENNKSSQQIAVPGDLEVGDDLEVQGPSSAHTTIPKQSPPPLSNEDIEFVNNFGSWVQKKLSQQNMHQQENIATTSAAVTPPSSTTEPSLLAEILAKGQNDEHLSPPSDIKNKKSWKSSPSDDDDHISKMDANANPPTSAVDIDDDIGTHYLIEGTAAFPIRPEDRYDHDQGDDEGIPNHANDGLEDDEDGWEDIDSDFDSDDDDDDDEDAIFDLDLDELNIDVLEQVAEAQVAGGGVPGNLHLILNLQNENDLEEMLGMLEPVAQNANLNNIQFGFILDGVIDIQGADAKRSRWVAVEDEDDGHLTYTLKISIE